MKLFLVVTGIVAIMFLGYKVLNIQSVPIATTVIPTLEAPTDTPIPTDTPTPVPQQSLSDTAYKVAILQIVKNCINNEDAIIQNGLANGTLSSDGIQTMYQSAITQCYRVAGLTPPTN